VVRSGGLCAVDRLRECGKSPAVARHRQAERVADPPGTGSHALADCTAIASGEPGIERVRRGGGPVPIAICTTARAAAFEGCAACRADPYRLDRARIPVGAYGGKRPDLRTGSAGGIASRRLVEPRPDRESF